MNFILIAQVLLLLFVCLFIDCSPISDSSEKESEGRVFRMQEKPDFPVADIIEENPNIKTHVIGKMDDLEATTWISSLSELNFTFPPDMAHSFELQDFNETET